MVIFQGWNIRALDLRVCVTTNVLTITRKWCLSPTIWAIVLNFSIRQKQCFSLFPWEQFALDRERKGATVEEGRERGGVPAGSRWCVCLLNASTCSVSVDLWPCHRQPGSPTGPGVKGHRGALYSRPAGPARPCHPPAEKGSHAHRLSGHRLTRGLTDYFHMHSLTRSWPDNQHRCQDAGQPCRCPRTSLPQQWGGPDW